MFYINNYIDQDQFKLLYVFNWLKKIYIKYRCNCLKAQIGIDKNNKFKKNKEQKKAKSG